MSMLIQLLGAIAALTTAAAALIQALNARSIRRGHENGVKDHGELCNYQR